MTKSELKNGMIVKYRNGKVRLVLNGELYHMMGERILYTADLDDWDNDLKSMFSGGLDIMSVRSTANTTLWTRPEVPEQNEMTIAELEKLTGLTNLKITKQ